MSETPTECKCPSCECGTYTYNESQICASCKENKHASGQKRWSNMVVTPQSINIEEKM